MNDLITTRVGIVYTDSCNFKCTFCAVNKEYDRHPLDLEQFKKIVDKLVEVGITEIEITPIVGEITLNKDFMRMLDYAIDKEMVVEVHTNLSNWNNWRKMLPYRPKFSRLLKLTISVYGTNAYTFEEITKNTRFDMFKYNLINLLKEDMKYLNHVTVTHRTPFIEFDDIVDTLEVYSEVGLITLEFLPENGNWGGHMSELTELDKDIPEDRLSGRTSCPALDYFTGIWPDGDVSYCGAHDLHKKEIVGNIFDSVDDVYAVGGAIDNIREAQMKGMWSGLCKTCNWFYR